eukprot:m.98026 g.98026  ORF g.98026 m.98026 type:complete len:375 (+) comp13996_c0_seq8:1102-2226(+)
MGSEAFCLVLVLLVVRASGQCRQDTAVYTCDGVGLTAVMDLFTLPSGITDLRLLNNLITSLPSGNFFGGYNLRALSLTGNQITSVHSSAFSGTAFLMNLDLAFNQISFIASGAFASLSNLQYLRLAGNRIVSFGPASLSYTYAMRELDLSSNTPLLNCIPSDWSAPLTAMPSNTKIYSGSSNAAPFFYTADLPAHLCPPTTAAPTTTTPLVTSCPGSGPLANVCTCTGIYADCSARNLTSVPYLGNMRPEIQTLDLSDNLITYLPSNSFLGLSFLHTLHLSNNPVMSIDSFTFNSLVLSTLQTLNMSGVSMRCCGLEGLRTIGAGLPTSWSTTPALSPVCAGPVGLTGTLLAQTTTNPICRSFSLGACNPNQAG